MRIKKKTWQYRRDFTAIYVCEHCGYEHEGKGYDDYHYHQEVIPAWPCPECKKTATRQPTKLEIDLKYPEYVTV